MQYEVDSYILEYMENENKYYITFKDSVGNNCKIEINKEVFETYRDSKKTYVKMENDTRRHTEFLTLTEEEIYNKTKVKGKSAEETYIDDMDREKLLIAEKSLTDTQMRRIELHIVHKIGTRELARLERVRRKQVEKSINWGMKKLEKILKNLEN